MMTAKVVSTNELLFHHKTHMSEITQYANCLVDLAPNSHKKTERECANRFMRVARKRTTTVSHASHSIKKSGRNGEKMYSVTNRHECSCEDLSR